MATVRRSHATCAGLCAVDAAHAVIVAVDGRLEIVASPLGQADVSGASALHDALSFMAQCDLQQLWIMADVGFRVTAEQLVYADAQGWNLKGEMGGEIDAQTAWIHAYRRGVYTPAGYDLVFPALETRAPLGTVPTADRLLAVLARYADALGTRYYRSPGATGARLLRELHSGKTAIHLDAPGNMPPPAAMRAGRLHQDSPIMWKRSLTGADLDGMTHYVSYDVNGQHLAATSSLLLGVGEPIHAQGSDAAHLIRGMWMPSSKGAPKMRAWPGYYRVQLLPLSPSFDADGGIRDSVSGVSIMPGPLYRKRYEGRASQDDGAWVSGPTYELLRHLGYPIVAHECYVYPEHHRLLEPWYKRLRDARATLMDDETPDSELALALVKATYTKTFGGLAYRGRGDDDPLRRPDWRHAIIAKARANHYRRMLSALDSGFSPVSVSEDTLGYLTRDLDALAFAELAGLPIDTQLGHLKVKDSFLLSEHPELRDALLSSQSDMYHLQKLLVSLRQHGEETR